MTSTHVQQSYEGSSPGSEPGSTGTRRGAGVALSGGGHRAAVFALGVLLYLVRCGRNGNVAHITSVSGGSITNAYVGLVGNYRNFDTDEFDQIAGALALQLSDRGSIYSHWLTRACIAVSLALLVLAAFAVFLVGPSPSVLLWSVPLLVFSIVALAARGWLFEKALDAQFFSCNGRPARCSDLKGRPPFHVITAAEGQSGEPAHFAWVHDAAATTGPHFRPSLLCPSFSPVNDDEPLSRAVRASAAYPGAFPPVRIPGSAIDDFAFDVGYKRWTPTRPTHLVLVDGGVIDNMGLDWFFNGGGAGASPLIVVSSSANRIPRTPFRSQRWFATLTSLIRSSAIPYHLRERNQRRALLQHFRTSYAGSATPDRSGAIIHIGDSPYDLAFAIANSESTVAGGALVLTDEDLQIYQSLSENASWATGIKARAAAVIRELDRADNETDGLRVLAAWRVRARKNADVPTRLRALGRETTIELMRHGFAMAMAKLHIVLNYPLHPIPSAADFENILKASETAARMARGPRVATNVR